VKGEKPFSRARARRDARDSLYERTSPSAARLYPAKSLTSQEYSLAFLFLPSPLGVSLPPPSPLPLSLSLSLSLSLFLFHSAWLDPAVADSPRSRARQDFKHCGAVSLRIEIYLAEMVDRLTRGDEARYNTLFVLPCTYPRAPRAGLLPSSMKY